MVLYNVIVYSLTYWKKQFNLKSLFNVKSELKVHRKDLKLNLNFLSGMKYMFQVKKWITGYPHQLLAVTLQKQPSRGVFRKRCSENMQQTYRITPKCDFNEVACNLLKSHFGMGVPQVLKSHFGMGVPQV